MALNRTVLIAGAIELADSEGLPAVTIRRIAQQHGVTATALYAHFRDKDELLDAMADHLLGEVVLPDPGAGLDAVLTAFVQVLRRHPAVTELVRRRVLLCTPGLRITERVLAVLHRDGHTIEQAATTSQYLLTAAVALVGAEPGHRRDAKAVRTQKAYLSALDPDLYPHIITAAVALSTCANPDDHYTRAVQMLVRGTRCS